MTNVWKIARKEFADLLGNIILPIALVVFFALILASAIDLKDAAVAGSPDPGSITQEYFHAKIIYDFFEDMSVYGGIVAVLIGFYSISSEKIGNALNTLASKPLYRDTIINGKIIGCTLFMICVYALAVALFVSSMLILVGARFGDYLPSFAEKATVIMAFTLIYSLIMLGASMLISLLIQKRGTALLACAVFFGFVSYSLPAVVVSGNLSLVLADQDTVMTIIGYISPNDTLVSLYSAITCNMDASAFSILSNNLNWAADMLVLLGVVLIANYVAFMRRDIS